MTTARQLNMKTLQWGISLLCLLHCGAGKKNVLFLVSDDFRPSIGAYEGRDMPSQFDPKMHTPNLDGLANKSMLMKRAYVQFALCSPSRSSFLTGRRPDTTHVYNLEHAFRNVGGNFTTIPKYFKQHGYKSIGMGKIFHYDRRYDHNDFSSWDDFFYPPNYCFWQVFNASWIAVEPEDLVDNPLPDQQTAEHAIEVINEMAQTPDQPWFIAVGFHKPHLPYTFPARFRDFYPREELKEPDNVWVPINMPDIAWYDYGIGRQFQDLRTFYHMGELNRTFPMEVVMDLRRAYYSSISYTDHLFGAILDALEASGQADNTIISWVGDHGYQLGEHAEWTKETNFEIATHAPMMIRVPGLTDEGMETEQAVEFVDLFPTLVDLADLPYLPLCPEESASVIDCREGSSMVPLFYGTFGEPWKKAVFSQMSRKQNGIDYMGYSVLVNYIRYTEWVRFDGKPVYKPMWEENIGVELYDHWIDPEENYNHADEWQYAMVQQRLSDVLHAGWRAALPEEDPNDPQDAVWMAHPADLDIPEHDYGPTCTNPIY